MVICKDGNFAFVGANVDEAYKAYLNSDCDHTQSGPDGLEWFIASRADLTMSLVQKPAVSTTKKVATKRKA